MGEEVGTPPPVSKEIEVPGPPLDHQYNHVLRERIRKIKFSFNQMINIFVGVTFLYDSFNIKAQKMQIQHMPDRARYKSLRKGWNTKEAR